MQSIERYGVVALLFLVVTVVAVLIWDEEGEKDGAHVAQASEAPAVEPAQREPEASSGLVQRSTPAARPVEGTSVRLRPTPKPRALQREALLAARDEPEPAAPAGLDPARTEPEGAAPDSREWFRRAQEDPPPAERQSVAPASQPRPRNTSRNLYVIRGGDTLSEISQRELGTSKRWKEIVELNPGLDPGKLNVGARIKLPAGSTSDVLPAERTAQPGAGTARPANARVNGDSGADATRYQVRPGDSLWKVAERTLGQGERWREIADLNPSVNPDRLLVGQVLRLPAGVAAVPSSVRPGPTVAAAPATPEKRRVK